MKKVKVSITVPEPLLKFAEKKASERAKEREERPNLSAVFTDLLLQERDRLVAEKTTRSLPQAA